MICLGIDIGTQSLKALVLEDGQHVRGTAQVSYTWHAPQAGWAEQDTCLWEKALSLAVPRALERAERKPSDVRAMAVAAQLDGCIAVDEQGCALTSCLIWMDRRAGKYVPSFDCEFRFQQRTGLVADPSHMAAKICWLREHITGLSNARFHQPTSYLVERLCGEAVFDHGLASTTMLYGLASGDYDPELLAAFGIESRVLPSIAEADQIAGQLTRRGAALCGLVPRIPVAVGTGDDFATILGAGISEPGPMVCVLGTAEVVGAVSTNRIVDSTGLVETHGYLDNYFIENPGWLSGGAVTWLRSLLKIESDAEFDVLAATAPPGSEGLSFLPALNGAMAPEWQPNARACFYGLTSRHGPEHMARALLEGCAFAMRDIRERLCTLGVPVDPILVLGGGARSSLWAQIRADLCQVSVECNEQSDACALGAALLATAALAKQSAGELCSRLGIETRSITPCIEHREIYEQAYQRYRLLFASLSPLWDERA